MKIIQYFKITSIYLNQQSLKLEIKTLAFKLYQNYIIKKRKLIPSEFLSRSFLTALISALYDAILLCWNLTSSRWTVSNISSTLSISVYKALKKRFYTRKQWGV